MRRGVRRAVPALAVVATLLTGVAVAQAVGPGSRLATLDAAAVPDGWTAQRYGTLSFALPPGFAPVPARAGMASAAGQWTKTDDRKLVVEPAIVVYAENGAVGPLAARTALVARSRSSEFGVQPSSPLRSVPVPGSAGAVSAQWAWDQSLGATKVALPSRQVEVVVQLDGRQEYGLSLGGPASYVTDELVADFLSSIAVAEPAS